jgi:hypothetical protein
MSDLWFSERKKMSVERWANCQEKEFAHRSKRSLSLKERTFWEVRSLSDWTMLSYVSPYVLSKYYAHSVGAPTVYPCTCVLLYSRLFSHPNQLLYFVFFRLYPPLPHPPPDLPVPAHFRLTSCLRKVLWHFHAVLRYKQCTHNWTYAMSIIFWKYLRERHFAGFFYTNQSLLQ